MGSPSENLHGGSGVADENLKAQEAAKRRRRYGFLFWLSVGWLVALATLAITADVLPLFPHDLSGYPVVLRAPRGVRLNA